MTTEQGNKLIAEFMGFKYCPLCKLNGIRGVLIKEGELSMHLDFTKPFHPKYHSSWDWLMPVVEKISRIKCIWDNAEVTESDTYYPRTFGMLNEKTLQPMVRFNSSFLHEAPTLIEATWKAVVEFIQFYNQNKKP